MNDGSLVNIPKHVAIIMDGNRRWAKRKGLPAVAGHDFVSEKTLEPLVDKAIGLGIEYLTFWAFSTENWQRSKREVEGIMRIFRRGLVKRVDRLTKKGVRLKILGDVEKFPEDISRRAKEWVEASKNNRKITVCFALNYGGRDEILRAIGRLIASRMQKDISRLPGVSRSPSAFRDDKAGLRSVQALLNAVTYDEIEQYLDTAGMPDPDLIVRTGGEQRLSGFMSWQSAYSELWFTETLMPDFTGRKLQKAIEEYGRRKRRYGR